MEHSVLVLDNPVQNYAWGSRTAIAELLGRPAPSALPEAELWIGAHPKAPSRVVAPAGLGTLDRVIQDDPIGVLGSEVCDRFGNELPFLLKVLAAAEPLSIQAHPSHEQARRGWARENAEGVPVDAPRRNYRDPNHKPELVSALTPFTALKGFRTLDEVARNLEPVARPEIAPELGRLAREQTPLALRALFARLMTLDPEEQAPVLKRATGEAARRRKTDRAWEWVARLMTHYPGDVSVLEPSLSQPRDARARRGALPSRGRAARLPRGHGPRDHGELGQRAAGRADPEARGRAGAAGDPRLRGARPRGAEAGGVGTGRARLPHAGTRVRAGPARGHRRGARSPRARGEASRSCSASTGEAKLLAGGETTPLGPGRSVLVPAALDSYSVEGDGRLCRARVPA